MCPQEEWKGLKDEALERGPFFRGAAEMRRTRSSWWNMKNVRPPPSVSWTPVRCCGLLKLETWIWTPPTKYIQRILQLEMADFGPCVQRPCNSFPRVCGRPGWTGDLYRPPVTLIRKKCWRWRWMDGGMDRREPLKWVMCVCVSVCSCHDRWKEPPHRPQGAVSHDPRVSHRWPLTLLFLPHLSPPAQLEHVTLRLTRGV